MSEFTHPLRPHERVDQMSDDRIDACFRTIGGVHKDAARALIGLLGEVERRGIHTRAALELIEYGRRHGGLSTNQIGLARRLDRRTRDLPCLRDLFQHGIVPLNRLRVVIGIATPALDAEVASLVTRVSKAALEVWVRSKRMQDANATTQTPAAAAKIAAATEAAAATAVAGAAGPAAAAKIERAAGSTAAARPGGEPITSAPATRPDATVPPGRVALTIGAVVSERLWHEQARLAAQRGRTVSMDELLLHLLDGDDRSRSRYIPVIAVSQDGESRALRTVEGDVPVSEADLAGMEAACLPIDLAVERERLAAVLAARPPTSRARPEAVDRYLQARSGGGCEFTSCREPGHGAHHWVPYAESGSHHPDNLSVLCREHMDLADRGLVQRVEMRVVLPSGSGPAGRAVARYEAERRRAVERKITAMRETAGGTARPGTHARRHDPGGP